MGIVYAGALAFLLDQPGGKAVVQFKEKDATTPVFECIRKQKSHDGNTLPSPAASPASSDQTSGEVAVDLGTSQITLAGYLGELGEEV